MHETLNRARHHNRGRFLTGAALSFVGTSLLIASLVGAPSMAAQQPKLDADALITGSTTPATSQLSYELRIEITKPGREGLNLAGRLSEDGGLITRPVSWTIFRTLGEAGTGGTIVHDSETPVANIQLEPGYYRVEASYGSVTVVKPVEIVSAQYVGMTFVFNVGGLRTLSTVAKNPLPKNMRAIHKVYATSGIAAGQLVATSDVPGGLMRLGAGNYRLESEIEPGNTVTETSVSIRPGILTTLQLDHEAGMIEITVPAETKWTLTSADGAWRSKGSGNSIMTLAPGDYIYQQDEDTRAISIKAGNRTVIGGSEKPTPIVKTAAE